MATFLHIIKGNKLTKVPLSSKETLQIKAESETQYQLVDENGKLLSNVKTELVGNDLNIFVDGERANLILEEYNLSYPIAEKPYFVEQSLSFDLSTEMSEKALRAGEVSKPFINELGIFGFNAFLLSSLMCATTRKDRNTVQPKSEENSAETQPKVEEDKPAEEPKVEENSAETQPKMEDENQAETQPKVEEENPVEESEVEENSAETQPKVEENSAETQPKVEEEKPAEEPKVEENSAETQPKVGEENPAEEPKVEENSAETQPKVEEENPAEEPKVEENSAETQPKVEEEKPAEEPKVEENSAETQPKVGEENPAEEPKVEENSAETQPKVEENSAETQPKVEENSAETQPKVEENSAETQPKVGEENPAEEPEVEENSAETQPKVEEEKPAEEPKVEENSAETQPKVEEENPAEEPKVEENSAETQPKVEEEKPAEEPKVEENSAETQPKVGEENPAEEPKVEENSAETQPKVGEENPAEEPEVEENSAETQPKVEEEKPAEEPKVEENSAETQPRVEEENPAEEPKVEENSAETQPKVEEEKPAEEPKVEENSAETQPKVGEENPAEEPKVEEEKPAEEPEVEENSAETQPKVEEEKPAEEPEVEENSAETQPKVEEENPVEESEVEENSAETQPKVEENSAETQPKVEENSAETQPKVEENSAETQPKVGEENPAEEPKVEENSAETQPKVEEEKPAEEPEVEENSAETQPKVGEEKPAEEPKVEENSAETQPKVEEENPVEESEVEENSAETQPKVEEEKAAEEPKVEENSAETQPKVEEEKPAEEPKVEENSAETQPKVGEENPAEEPKVEEEKPAEEPKVEENSAETQPKVEEENPAEEPKVEENSAETQPKVEEEKPAEEPKVEENSAETQPKVGEENPAEEPKVEENSAETQPKVEEEKPAEEPEVEENSAETQPKVEEENPAEEPKSEEEKRQPAIVLDEIADDDIVNIAESEESKLMISGSVSNVADGEKVVIEIGTQQFEATVTEGKFNQVIDTALLVTNHQVKVSIQGVEVVRPYQVDLIPPTVGSITIDPIVSLNANNLDQMVTIQGTLEFGSDDDLAIVSLHLNGEEFIVNVDGNRWSYSLKASKLINANEHKIEVQAIFIDPAYNGSSLKQELTYEVLTPEITLDLITSDDFINVTEGKETITLKGSTKNVEDGETVNVVVGTETFAARITDGRFSVEASGQILAQNRRVSATLATGKAETSREYEVDPNLNVAIDITQIGQSFSTDLAKTSRISGVVEFDGIYALGQNSRMIRAVNVVIGNKTYTAGFDGKAKSFYVDIPNIELAELNGQTVQINFLNRKSQAELPYTTISENDPINLFEVVYDLTQNTDGSYTMTPKGEFYGGERPAITVKSVTLTSNVVEDSKVVKQTDMTTISGTVSGDAKPGDTVKIQVGDKIITTTVVEENRTFSTNIESSQLNHHSQVTAILETQDIVSGKSITVKDTENYIAPNLVSATFVSQHSNVPKAERKTDHTKEDHNFPYFINGILYPDSLGFNRNHPIGGNQNAPFTIKYHFMTTEEANSTPWNATGISGYESDYTDREKESIRFAYREIEKYVNIKFVEVENVIDADSKVYKAKINDRNNDIILGLATPGGNLTINGKSLSSNLDNPTLKASSYNTNIHEIGHTLQLDHPAGENKGFAYEETSEFSVESYNGAMSLKQGTIVSRYSSLRLFDLATLHYRYGVNPEARKGNDTYGFKDYNATENDGALYIWDGAGVDVFDASNEKVGVNVNLTPGSWIYRGNQLKSHFAVEGKELLNKHNYFGLDENIQINGSFVHDLAIKLPGFPPNLPVEMVIANLDRLFPNAPKEEVDRLRNTLMITHREFNVYTTDQAFIGYGTQIENLIGSDYDDTLTGNNADNNIQGGAGNDVIRGGAGNDYLDGGTGTDTMYGGSGDDRYIVDNKADTVIELVNEGTDTVFSLVDYKLSDNVENLTLLGTEAKRATGNAQDNVIIANNMGNTLIGEAGDDRLIGGLGADILTGGEGNDTFVFQTELNGNIDIITDFEAGDKIALSTLIFKSLSKGMENISDYIQYNAEDGKLFYNADGDSNRDSVHFATLNKGAVIEQSQYEII